MIHRYIIFYTFKFPLKLCAYKYHSILYFIYEVMRQKKRLTEVGNCISTQPIHFLTVQRFYVSFTLYSFVILL